MSQAVTDLKTVRAALLAFVEASIAGVEGAPNVERDDPSLDVPTNGVRVMLSVRRVVKNPYPVMTLCEVTAHFSVAIQKIALSASEREAVVDAIREAIGDAVGKQCWLPDYLGLVEPGDLTIETDAVVDAEPEHLQIIALTVMFLSTRPNG